MKLLITLFFCFSSGNYISQKETKRTIEEEKAASLSCSFNTSSTNYYIHWYRQYPGKEPEFILLNGSYSRTADFAKERFSSTADKSTELATVRILRVQIEDSAVYYCALTSGSGSWKLIFGMGTKLTIETKKEAEPSYYELQDKENTTKACLATGFSSYSATNNVELFKNNNSEPTRITGESFFGRVALMSQNDSCPGKTGDDSCGAGMGGDLETDEKTSFLYLTVLGLRILFLKSIVFNVLMTLRIWIS